MGIWYQGAQPIVLHRLALFRMWVRQYGLLLVVLVLANVYIYFSTLDLFFWHDDFLMIKLVRNFTFSDYLDYTLFRSGQENPLFQAIVLETVFRPLTHYVYWLLGWWLFKTSPTGYHAVNLFIHICNSLLVFWTAFSLTRHRISSFIAALLYLCAVYMHIPAMVSLHTVNESLFTFFALLAFLLYTLRRSGTFGRWAGFISVISYALAFLCNERAVIIPVLILVFDLLFIRPLPQQFSQKTKILIRYSWPYWALSIAYVLLRLPALLEGVSNSGSRYEYRIGFWALPKYYWGFKWFLLEYIEPLRAFKNAVFPSLHLDAFFGIAVLLLAIVIGAIAGVRILSRPLGSFPLRVVVFGLIWFLVLPAPIIFAKPFAAHYFAGAIFGLCLVGGYLGGLILDKLPAPGVRGAALALFTIVTVLSANLLAEEYIRDPLRNPYRANQTRQVLELVSNSDEGISQYNTIYLVGFPAKLFSLRGSSLIASTAFELFVGYPAQIEQVASFEDVPNSPYRRILVLTYKNAETIQKISLHPNCKEICSTAVPLR